jgi:hypothetical protein
MVVYSWNAVTRQTHRMAFLYIVKVRCSGRQIPAFTYTIQLHYHKTRFYKTTQKSVNVKTFHTFCSISYDGVEAMEAIKSI